MANDAQPTNFDVVVIGAGPGGYVAAIRAAQLGLRTACVERRATLGGTCLNIGCIPSKALLHASGGIEGLFRKNKVTWFRGQAAFVDTRTIRLVFPQGEASLVTARHVVVTTGSSVAALPSVPLDGEVVVDWTGALALSRVPDHMIVIGGGVIGLEFGSVWRRLGARVTVVEVLDQIMPEFDDKVRAEAARLFRGRGWKSDVHESGRRRRRGKAGNCLDRAGGRRSRRDVECRCRAGSIDRRANTHGLALDAVGVSINPRGQIAVDAQFATAVPGIWAIGDCVPGPTLAHKAEDEGLAMAESIAGQPGTVNAEIIPSVVYTMPEIAGVGQTERAARDREEIRVGRFPLAANSRAKTNRDTEEFMKVVADAATNRVLGLWIVSSLAATLIAQVAQALEFGANSEDIAYTCHAHPTHVEALKEAAMAIRGKAIHV